MLPRNFIMQLSPAMDLEGNLRNSTRAARRPHGLCPACFSEWGEAKETDSNCMLSPARRLDCSDPALQTAVYKCLSIEDLQSTWH